MSGGDTPKRCLLRRALPYKAEEGRSSGFETSRRVGLTWRTVPEVYDGGKKVVVIPVWAGTRENSL